jgi:hypothetical protein
MTAHGLLVHLTVVDRDLLVSLAWQAEKDGAGEQSGRRASANPVSLFFQTRSCWYQSRPQEQPYSPQTYTPRISSRS